MHRLWYCLVIFFLLALCSAEPTYKPTPFALAEQAIKERERRVDRSMMSSHYRTLHANVTGNASARMMPLAHHPFASKLRDTIYQQSAVFAKRDAANATMLVENAIAQLPDVQRRALQRLPRRTTGGEAPPVLASTVSLPPEITELIHGKAVRQHLCATLQVAKETALQDIAQACVRASRLDLLDYLFWLGAEPNALASDGYSLLYFAVKAKDAAMAERLMYYGADPRWKSAVGAPLLTIAVMNADLPMAALLINEEDALWQTKEGDSLLSISIHNDDVAMTRLLLKSGLREWVKRTEMPLLYEAVDERAENVVAFLLSEEGVDPNGENKRNDACALWLSVLRNDHATANVLLGAGADANWQGARVLTLLEMAVAQDDVKIATLLLQYGADRHHPRASHALIHAVTMSSYHMVKLLLEGGIDPNSQLQGIPVLYYALIGRRMDIANLFRAHRVDVNVLVFGKPLLHAPWPNIEIVSWLLEQGADPWWQDADGSTLFSRALIDGNYALVQLLFHHQAAHTVATERDLQRGG